MYRTSTRPLPLQGLAHALLGALALAAPARAEPARPFLDIPIKQHVNRMGDIRYSIWVTVGDRTVEALLDTGSTGLRVLPMVVPGDPDGVATSVSFGAGILLDGTAVRTRIGIGSRAGTASIQIAQRASCTDETPNCDAAHDLGDDFRIGNDGLAHQGFPAILGIGFPFRGSGIDNPLQAIGVRRWIVDLPRPGEIAPGHLLLDPPDGVAATFTRLARHGAADADGCLKGGPLAKEVCGTVLFDSGAPAIQVALEDATATSPWPDGASGSFAFKTVDAKRLPLAFNLGESGGLLGAETTAPNRHDPPGTFILAGIAPFYAYDILYDAPSRTVALRARPPASPAPIPGEAHVPEEDMLPDVEETTRHTHRAAGRDMRPRPGVE